jgi:hypothetical protein
LFSHHGCWASGGAQVLIFTSLNLADCNSITGIVLWALCFPFLINLDLGRCSGITDTELEVFCGFSFFLISL